MYPAMSEDARTAFLSEARVAVLAVSRPGRPPLQVPIWFSFENGLATIHTAKGQRKTRALEAAGEFSLCIQEPTPPYRYVTIAGPIVAVESISPAERGRMVRRYFDRSRAEAYLARTAGDAADDLAVRMRPTRWSSVDFRGLD